MSLGALDFGLIIDGAVIIVENTLRRIAEQQTRLGRRVHRDERLAEVLKASEEMVRPTVYGQIVIFLVFVPCLSFQGVEGKMFSPMVITLMLALASAFLLSVTFVPAMAAILFRGKVAEREVATIRAAKRLYAPALRIGPRSSSVRGCRRNGDLWRCGHRIRFSGPRFHPNAR